ncbi:MAG TPA: sigma-70 family RNA polymerase sigma factor [Sedimentisphaerales bacterium]|nr:sigma-70 family RNA polymerase sigma factor [Sedimentisphaerales bacterium]
MKENTEQDWVESARRREPAAIAELYRRYWRAARAAAFGVTADLDLAEDAASEAFYAAIDGLHDLKDTQRFGPWLRTIVVRTATHLHAARAKETAADPHTLPDAQSPPPGLDLEQQEVIALIHQAVRNLSQTLREAMSLFYFEGYSLKEAARFLDVPTGTLKRRLHEGRRRLRDSAEQIMKGTKPMDPQREQILRQLTNAANEGIGSEAFYQAMRQVLRLRPMPHDLMRKLMQRHLAAKQGKTPMSPEKERLLREYFSRVFRHSERARDPNHPVGAVANAIRAALPEFQQWHVDMSQVDVSQLARQMFDGKSFSMPPGFAEPSEASYISARQAWLVQDGDGFVCTTYELMQKTADKQTLNAQIKQGSRSSDVLFLVWKRLEALELRAVEELLRRLSEAIAPKLTVRFITYEDPRYRAALRMQLADNPVPAAIGGVHNPWPGLPEGVSVASVLLCLEPWAAAQTGQPVELAPFWPLSFLDANKSR